ncbi:hypothetical protein JET14_12290 [Martelella lutilitoris]|uniref:Uncharacterized protein n=1 Tax=Martelella lutilitoris TaxID=2583532 RepID=A0A7T7KJY0_9HYPH|nr:hypothetical protein [Martelella lutilitoris]QQM29117.1 hypothetical protein JET14_12290 [Martelella lutilitoris]
MRFDSAIRAYGEPGRRDDEKKAKRWARLRRRRSPGLALIVLAGVAFWGGLVVLLVGVL